MEKPIELEINGERRQLNVDPALSLLSVLRDHLDLTGTKYGCGEGQCGACTVLLAGLPRRSCLTRVGAVGSRPITTIEGLASRDRLHPVQQAFLDAGAFQCGYCTSGMILSAVALLKARPDPSDAEITQFMTGNVCRCGTYQRIVAAIRGAARRMKEERH